MGEIQGLRSRSERLSDFWSGLDIWSRYGLSFVGAVAIIFLLYLIVGWLL